MEEKQLEAIPMDNFRVLIYKVSMEDFVRKNWKDPKLNIDTNDDFFINVDQESLCKALACTIWQHKDKSGIAFFNRVWAKKMVEMGAPKDQEYAANIPVEAIEQLTTALRKLYKW